MLAPGQMQTRYGSRNADRLVTPMVKHGIIFPVPQEHFGPSRRRCLLTKVIADRRAGRRSINQETTAANIARRRMRHRQGKGGGHGGVDGVAAPAQDGGPDLGRLAFLRHDHAAFGFGSTSARDRSVEEDEDCRKGTMNWGSEGGASVPASRVLYNPTKERLAGTL